MIQKKKLILEVHILEMELILKKQNGYASSLSIFDQLNSKNQEDHYTRNVQSLN